VMPTQNLGKVATISTSRPDEYRNSIRIGPRGTRAQLLSVVTANNAQISHRVAHAGPEQAYSHARTGSEP
jgi:hypothetical protein